MNALLQNKKLANFLVLLQVDFPRLFRERCVYTYIYTYIHGFLLFNCYFTLEMLLLHLLNFTQNTQKTQTIYMFDNNVILEKNTKNTKMF